MSAPATRLAPLMALLALAACGGGGSSGNDLAGPVTDPGTDPPPVDNGEPYVPPDDAGPTARALADGTAYVEVTGASSAEALLISDDGALRFTLDGETFALANTGRSPAVAPDYVKFRYYEGDGVEALAVVEALPGIPPFDIVEQPLRTVVFGAWLLPGGVAPEDANIAGFVAGTATPRDYAFTFEQPGLVLAYKDNAVAVERTAAGERFLAGAIRLEYSLDDAALRGVAELFDAETAEPWGTLDTGVMDVEGGPGVAGPFAGDEATTSLGHSGSASGSFFDPQGSTVGGTFRLEGPSELAGGFAGEFAGGLPKDELDDPLL